MFQAELQVIHQATEMQSQFFRVGNRFAICSNSRSVLEVVANGDIDHDNSFLAWKISEDLESLVDKFFYVGLRPMLVI